MTNTFVKKLAFAIVLTVFNFVFIKVLSAHYQKAAVLTNNYTERALYSSKITVSLVKINDKEITNFYQVNKMPFSIIYQNRLSAFVKGLLKKLGFHEGKTELIDDATENTIREHELIFVVFGLLFIWMAIKIILERNK